MEISDLLQVATVRLVTGLGAGRAVSGAYSGERGSGEEIFGGNCFSNSLNGYVNLLCKISVLLRIFYLEFQ